MLRIAFTLLRVSPICAAVALCTLLAAAAPPANQGTFRLISKLPGYTQPGGLIEGSPGVFYSAAELAGTGSAAVYSVTSKGLTTTLASFPSGYVLGSSPVSASNGRFYDAVEYQANPPYVFSVSALPGVQQYPAQTIFPSLTQGLPGGTILGRGINLATGWYVVSCNQDGTVAPIYSFPGGDYLEYPVIYASDGNYYGVDFGATAGPYAYRVTPSGSLTSLHSFPKTSFSGVTISPLLQGSDGHLYGAAPYGGTNGTGSIYRLSLSGQYSLVYTFPKSPAGFPTWLIQASDGNLYGTTSGDTQAAHGHSVLFRLTTSGQYTQLYAWSYSVCPCTLTQGGDGRIYGIAQAGEFFSWNGGLPKPAPTAPQFTPASGPTGTQVLIWGSNLLSPSVKFNGVAASSVTSSGPNYVLATVPTGATTGPVTVTTPGGSYTTPTSFTVQ